MSEIYLGQIEYANGDWARVSPRAVLVNAQWSVLLDRQREFPDEGLAFAPPAAGLGSERQGTYWVFRREPNARQNSGKDKFVVGEARSALVIVDLSGDTFEEARVKLFEQGVDLPRRFGDRAVVRLKQNFFCLAEFEVTTSHIRRARQHSTPTPLMQMPNAWASAGGVDGRTFVPAMAIPSLPVLRKVNWCGDADFVERVLLRARRHFTTAGSTEALPGKETLQRIARALDTNGLLASSDEDVETDLERLRSQWPRLLDKFEASAEMRELVLESSLAVDLIQDACKSAAETERTRLRPIVEAEIKASLSTELASLEKRIEAARTEHAGAVEKLAATTAILEQLNSERERLEGLTSTIRNEVKGISVSLQDQVDQLAPAEEPYAKTVIARLEAAVSGLRMPRFPESSPPWAAPRQRIAQEVSAARLHDLLSEKAAIYGVASLVEIDAFVRAGELVLLTGPTADRALQAYADCVTGGVVRSVGLDPAILGLHDLWQLPGARGYTAFAKAWTLAESSPTATVIVCFRCLDSAPFHLWLRAFSTILRSPQRPRNLLVFATPSGARRRDEDAYPNHTELPRWLVPWQPSDASGAAAGMRALATSTAECVTLLWQDSPVEAAAARPEFLSMIRNLDVDSSLRAARVAACLPAGPYPAFFANWLELLDSSTVTHDGSWPGLEDLRDLQFLT